jgi:hypothetical protein
MDLQPLLASNLVASFAVFGIFVIAMGVLAVLIVKWALAKDRPGRDAWKQRHFDAQAQAAMSDIDPPHPPTSGG